MKAYSKRLVKILVLLSVFVIFFADIIYAEEKSSNTGSVYYLNFKPESDSAWQKLARAYSERTGVRVKIETCANGTYADSLNRKLKEGKAPTLFQLTPSSLKGLEDYCFNLKNTRIYSELNNEAYVLKDYRNRICGIAYAVESYGIIVNIELLERAGYDIDDLDSFASLKKIAEDVTSRKKDLGFAAFCSSGMDKTSDWRFETHLANMPIHFEYQDKKVSSLDKIDGIYLDNLREVWDLYLNNSCSKPTEIASKSIEDARNEFLSNRAVFYQNGSWEYVNLTKGERGLNKFQLLMLPLYFKVGDEELQGLCTGTENYWCVNRRASAKDIKATLDFIFWCVTSEEGTKAMAQEMGLVIPFHKAAYSENIFIQQNAIYTAKGKKPVSWDFVTIPSEKWKTGLGKALTAYAAHQVDERWQDVVKAFVEGWTLKEKAR